MSDTEKLQEYEVQLNVLGEAMARLAEEWWKKHRREAEQLKRP